MRKALTPLIVLGFIVFSNSCQLIMNCEKGNGVVVEKQLQLQDDINEIELNGPYKVFLSQGDQQTISIKGEKNIVEFINTKVKGGEWEIEFSPCIDPKKEVEIYIQLPTIKEITINGSGEVICKSLFQTNKLDLNISGSGKFDMNVDIKELSSSIQGSGKVRLSGIAKKHEIEVNGSGDIEAYELATDESKIEVNGSGDVKVKVSYALDAEVNGSGDIYYKGNVKKISSSINGSGTLIQSN